MLGFFFAVSRYRAAAVIVVVIVFIVAATEITLFFSHSSKVGSQKRSRIDIEP